MCVACRHTLQWLTFSRILIFQKWSFETWVFLSFYIIGIYIYIFWFCLLDAWKINSFFCSLCSPFAPSNSFVEWQGIPVRETEIIKNYLKCYILCVGWCRSGWRERKSEMRATKKDLTFLDCGLCKIHIYKYICVHLFMAAVIFMSICSVD